MSASSPCSSGGCEINAIYCCACIASAHTQDGGCAQRHVKKHTQKYSNFILYFPFSFFDSISFLFISGVCVFRARSTVLFLSYTYIFSTQLSLSHSVEWSLSFSSFSSSSFTFHRNGSKFK